MKWVLFKRVFVLLKFIASNNLMVKLLNLIPIFYNRDLNINPMPPLITSWLELMVINCNLNEPHTFFCHLHHKYNTRLLVRFGKCLSCSYYLTHGWFGSLYAPICLLLYLLRRIAIACLKVRLHRHKPRRLCGRLRNWGKDRDYCRCLGRDASI